MAIQQSSPRQPGGVILLGRDYEGTELRWTSKLQPGATTLTLVGGVAYDVLAEHRQGFQNFTGSTLGVRGAPRRDEINDVSSFDQYAQAAWQFAPQWSLTIARATRPAEACREGAAATRALSL